jgi:hypothetical protein
MLSHLILNQRLGVDQTQGHGKHPKGYSDEDQNRKIQFPRQAASEDVVDRMVAILQETARGVTY